MFTWHPKNMKQLDRGEAADSVFKSFVVGKAIILTAEEFGKLEQDLSPEHLFLQQNRDFMYVAPNREIHCLLVRSEDSSKGLLLSLADDGLMAGYTDNVGPIIVEQGVPVEYLHLDGTLGHQRKASFYRKPESVREFDTREVINADPDCLYSFCVEKVIVLPDREYRRFCTTGLLYHQPFITANLDKMWVEEETECSHCLLVRGKNSKDGILVESQGFPYARYAAYVLNCSWLQLQGVPIQYEQTVNPPRKKPVRHQKNQER